MSDAVLEIRDACGIGVPGCYVVVAGFPVRAVEGWKIVLGDVSVVTPAAELVSIVECDCQFDV